MSCTTCRTRDNIFCACSCGASYVDVCIFIAITNVVDIIVVVVATMSVVVGAWPAALALVPQFVVFEHRTSRRRG